MSYNKPFHRNYRAIVKKQNSGYSNWAYIVDKEYVNSPEHFTRAFLIIQDDIKKLFEYVEPSDVNENTYSFRIHELFMRICIEVEANFKAILRENIYMPKYKNGEKIGKVRSEEKWNINDFKKVNKTHHLDNYSVEMPIWNGTNYRYQPFAEWQNNGSLSWYQIYNKCKHDRYEKFEQANFKNLMLSFTGLFILLSSQFYHESFAPGNTRLSVNTDSFYSGEFGIGDYLIIEFPQNWTDDEKYDFNWSELKLESDRFMKIDYNKI